MRGLCEERFGGRRREKEREMGGGGSGDGSDAGLVTDEENKTILNISIDVSIDVSVTRISREKWRAVMCIAEVFHQDAIV